MDQIAKLLTGPAGRHTGSLLVVFAVVWQMAWPIMQPKAEEFVKAQVNDRISTVEDAVKHLQVQNTIAQSDLATIKAAQRAQERKQDDANRLLIDILRELKQ